MPDDPSTDAPGARLLIAEDDPETGGHLEDLFSRQGYETRHITDGEHVLQEMTMLPPYDLVLLDVKLPEKDGFEVLREARQTGVDSPVIMLTVKDGHKHKLRGFDLGADDYVTKPFDTKELAARVEAVLLRSESALPDTGDVCLFGDITVHFPDKRAAKGEENLELTNLEFDIL